MRTLTICLIIAGIVLSGCAAQPAAQPTSAPTAQAPEKPMSSTPALLPDPNSVMPLTPTTLDYSPRASDKSLSRGGIFILEQHVVVRESLPAQASLQLKGQLPTPCHELRAQVIRDEQGQVVKVEVYTVFDVARQCADLERPFAVDIPLGAFSGKYSVTVNDQPAGTIN